MEKYIVITSSEDGLYIERLAKEEVEERVAEGYYGGDTEWLSELPSEHDPNYWGNVGVIIKGGRVVAPQAVKTVTRWEV